MWRIIRPVDGIIMGIGLNVAMVLAGSLQQHIPFIFYVYVFLAGLLVSSHAMVVNDIVDLEIDKINEPDRVLPQGLLSKRQSWLYAIFLAVAGIFFFVLIDLGGYDTVPFVWLYGLFHVILADIYNYKLKATGLVGNIVVAESSYALFLAGDLFLNGHLTLIPEVVGVMAFCASLSREIFKGIVDQEGDAQHGVRTLAVVLGPKMAKYIASAIFSVCLILAIFVFSHLYLLGKIGLVLVCGIFLYILYLAKDAEIPAQSKKIKSYILLGPLLLSPFLILDQLLQLTIK